MRLRERDKRDITVAACTGFDDDVYRWGDRSPIRAAVYPMGRSIDAQIYGDKVRDMRRMLYDGENVLLEVGMGVSLDGGAPAWRIKNVESWDHQSVVLELIPEGRRGAWGDD